MTLSTLLMPQCKGCLLADYSNGTCSAFIDPGYQYRKGACWGRCEAAEDMVRRLEAIVEYGDMCGAEQRAAKRELEERRGKPYEVATAAEGDS